MIDDDIIQLVDENGNITEVCILFSYEDEEKNEEYLFLYEKDDPDSIIVRKLTSDDELVELTDEEFEQASEVFNAFNEGE